MLSITMAACGLFIFLSGFNQSVLTVTYVLSNFQTRGCFAPLRQVLPFSLNVRGGGAANSRRGRARRRERRRRAPDLVRNVRRRVRTKCV